MDEVLLGSSTPERAFEGRSAKRGARARTTTSATDPGSRPKENKAKGIRSTKHTVRLGRVSPELKLWDSGTVRGGTRSEKSEPGAWARETYALFRTAKWVLAVWGKTPSRFVRCGTRGRWRGATGRVVVVVERRVER